MYKHVSGKVLLEWGNQTELFKVSAKDLLKSVSEVITELKLDIVKIPLKEPYHGTNQATCPLNLPGENERWYFDSKVNELFGYMSQRTKVSATRTIENLFKD
jgi:hypothetical protein